MAFYKTLLFDADGTLLDFAASERNALINALKTFAVEPSDALLSRYSEINLSLWKMLERGEIKKERLKVQRFETFCREFSIDADPEKMAEEYLSGLSREGILLDGAFTLLSHLYGISDIYIVTNGIKKVQTGRMSALSIKEFIKHIFISDEIGAEKPKREFFDYVENHIENFDKKHTLLIGDSLTSDIKGAIAAGIDCVWYNPEGMDAPADMDITYTVDSLADIEDIVLYGKSESVGDRDALKAGLSLLGVKFKENHPMREMTSFRIGGEADIVVFPETDTEIINSLSLLAKTGVPFTVLGNGSNVVFEDKGYRGTVITLNGYKSLSVDGNRVSASAGIALSALSAFANKYALSGLEFAYGIPGSVGGGVRMNAGAYGGMISDTLLSVKAFDTESGEIKTIEGDALSMSYRHSVFTENRNLIILSATFELNEGDKERSYEFMQTIMNKRRNSQPLDKPSAGSVFKKPADDIHVSKIIDEMGLKGECRGDIAVSPKHAGFMVNNGKGSARDLKDLIAYVRERFYEQYKIMLECEVIFIS